MLLSLLLSHQYNQNGIYPKRCQQQGHRFIFQFAEVHYSSLSIPSTSSARPAKWRLKSVEVACLLTSRDEPAICPRCAPPPNPPPPTPTESWDRLQPFCCSQSRSSRDEWVKREEIWGFFNESGGQPRRHSASLQRLTGCDWTWQTVCSHLHVIRFFLI